MKALFKPDPIPDGPPEIGAMGGLDENVLLERHQASQSAGAQV